MTQTNEDRPADWTNQIKNDLCDDVIVTSISSNSNLVLLLHTLGLVVLSTLYGAIALHSGL